MGLPPLQLAAALNAIAERIRLVDNAFDLLLREDPSGQAYVEWELQIAYTQLLTLAEAQDLPQLRADIARDLEAARSDCLHRLTYDSDGVPEVYWAGPPRRAANEGCAGTAEPHTEPDKRWSTSP